MDVPALVLHGADDPPIALSGGRASAAAIPGAELVAFPGMGHDLPRPLWGEITRRTMRIAARSCHFFMGEFRLLVRVEIHVGIHVRDATGISTLRARIGTLSAASRRDTWIG